MRRHILDHPISYYTVFCIVRYLPVNLCHLIGKVFVLIIYAFSKKDRKGLGINLSIALGKPADDPTVRKSVRQLFINYGRYMIDFFLLPQLPSHKVRKYFADIKGEEILQNALARGKGVILLSAHVGNWEIGGTMLRLFNYPLTVVTIKHNTAATNTLVNRLRQNKNIRVVEVDQSPFSGIEVLRHLQQNRIVAMNGDRDYFGTGRRINFMGETVNFPIGPVILAMSSGAAIIPAFVLKQPDGRYAGILENAIPLHSTDNREKAITDSLKTIARIFEKYIRNYPDQWYYPDPITAPLFPRTAS